MNYKMIPCVKQSDLQKAVNIQYDLNIHDIAEFLIYDVHYVEDYCIISLDEDDVMEPAYSWETMEDVHIFNCIRTYLRDVFPEAEKIIVEA